MNICQNIQNSLIPYLENELDSETEIQIENHISECSECAGFLSELQLSFDIIDEQKIIDVPNSFLESIENKIAEQENYNKPRTINHYLTQVFSYAAVIAIGLFAGNFIINTITNDFQPVSQSVSNENLYWNDLAQEPIESFLLSENLF